MINQSEINQIKCFIVRTKGAMILLILVSLLGSWRMSAQTGTVNFSGNYQDLVIPNNTSINYVTLTTVGGDGGRVKRNSTYHGGRGALVEATFEIGDKMNQLSRGGTLRFIVGGQGDSYDSMADADVKGMGGGGGTAIAYKGPYARDKWELLLVAGGGGGAYWSGFANGTDDGYPGRKYDPSDIGDGLAGYSGNREYAGAGAFGDSDGVSTTGHPTTRRSYAGWAGGPGAGEPTGGSAWDGGISGLFSGGWGFGAGGIGVRNSNAAGGGGGYTGGILGESKTGGKGGHSYFNTGPNSLLLFTQERGTTSSPQDGYAVYAFRKSSPVQEIRLAAKETKCINLQNSDPVKGANIGLSTCNYNNTGQQWGIDGSVIRLAKEADKCIDLDHSNTANGTNIQLWDCNGTSAQNWIYDVALQSIRSGLDFNKCLDLPQSSTADGTNIQLYQCNNTGAQKWIIAGVPSAMPTEANQRIHLMMDADKCVDVKDARTANGTNVQVNTCTAGNSQYFLFDGRQIKLQAAPDKCIGPDPNSSSPTAPNVVLATCTTQNLQEWYYDGFAKAFRSAVNTNMCLDVDHSGTADGTNIQLFECNGTDAQQFEIY